MPTIIILIAVIFALSELAVIIVLMRGRGKIEKSLRTKDLMLREVRHRLKNNLNMIGNIIRLRTLEEKDPIQRRKFNEIVSRITSIGMIHEHLRIGSDLSRLRFPEYVESLVEGLKSSFAPEKTGFSSSFPRREAEQP